MVDPILIIVERCEPSYPPLDVWEVFYWSGKRWEPIDDVIPEDEAHARRQCIEWSEHSRTYLVHITEQTVVAADPESFQAIRDVLQSVYSSEANATVTAVKRLANSPLGKRAMEANPEDFTQ